MRTSSDFINSRNAVLKYLALGDSYTIGESVDSDESFPFQLISRMNKNSKHEYSDPEIIARTGWTTQDLLHALEEKNPDHHYNLVTLLIGVNNQYQKKDTGEYAKDFELLLNKSIIYAGNKKENVIVVSIPDYGYTPFGNSEKEKISAEIDEFNNINKRITENHQIKYVDITFVSRNNDAALVANDGLHPSKEQYKLWVDEVVKSLNSQ